MASTLPAGSLVLSIEDIAARFPQARIAAVLCRDILVGHSRPAELDTEIATREAACRERWAGWELSSIPGVAAWREAYRAFGIRKTSYRSSVERLVKRVLAGERLPAINPFVDIYNAVSLTHVFCCGADDLAHLAAPLAFRFSRPGDSFRDMGAAEGEDPDDPPKPGEVVYADTGKVLCRRWNWRQDARSVITGDTRAAVVTLQANGPGDLDAAVGDFRMLTSRFCGGRTTMSVASHERPVVEIG